MSPPIVTRPVHVKISRLRPQVRKYGHQAKYELRRYIGGAFADANVCVVYLNIFKPGAVCDPNGKELGYYWTDAKDPTQLKIVIKGWTYRGRTNGTIVTGKRVQI